MKGVPDLLDLECRFLLCEESVDAVQTSSTETGHCHSAKSHNTYALNLGQEREQERDVDSVPEDSDGFNCAGIYLFLWRIL